MGAHPLEGRWKGIGRGVGIALEGSKRDLARRGNDKSRALLGWRPNSLDTDAPGGKQPFHRGLECFLSDTGCFGVFCEHRWRA